MNLLTLTQARVCLGIDGKTLLRWLADAQLPVVHDPHDGRSKHVRIEHLRQLARLHQRHLNLPEPEERVRQAQPAAPLPDALLAIPETLARLQQQIATLQQQVVALTCLLQQPPAQASVLPSPPPPPTHPPVSRARPKTPPHPPKTPHTPVHVIARVEYGQQGRYVVIDPKKGVLPFEPDSVAWFAWVKEQDSFRFVGQSGHFTAHHEWKLPHGAWRAHRQIRNRSYNVRLALAENLTIAVLEQAAEEMQAHTK